MCDGREGITDGLWTSFNTSSCGAQFSVCRTKWLRPTRFIIKTQGSWIRANEVNVGRVVLLYSANCG